MTLYPVAGQSAGYPVSTDSYGARQDTSDLAQEILDQVPDPLELPWSSGHFAIDASGNVTISYYGGGQFTLNTGVNTWFGSVLAVVSDILYITNPNGSIWTRQIGAYYYQGYGGSGGVNLQMDTNAYIRFSKTGDGKLSIYTSDGWSGTFIAGAGKTFVIQHPLDPDRWLVHACLEGPEAAVFYRGRVRLDGVGSAHVELPDYFTVLADEFTATVQVTPVLDGPDDPFGPVAATAVRDGRFVIRGEPMQNIAWRVEATRKDVPELDVEPLKDDVVVRGTGPYRWID